MSAITTYNDALRFLREAADALDQARAALKDIGLQHIGSRSGIYRLTVSQLAHRVEEAIRCLQNEECEECGSPVAESEACLEGRCQNAECADCGSTGHNTGSNTCSGPKDEEEVAA